MAATKEMTSGSPLPLILNFTIPLLFGNLLQQTYSLVDAAIVGRFLGVNSLAAIGAGTSVIFLILGFCIGCSCGFGIPVAQRFGAADYQLMRRYVVVSLQLTAIMSAILALITAFFCRKILFLIQTPGVIFDEAYSYLLITFIGLPCTFFYNLLANIIRALGNSRIPFWFLLFSTVLNIILDLIFILVFRWGVFGAGLATVIAQGIAAVLCYFYMYKHFPILATDKEDRRFRLLLVRRLLYMGIPMGLQFSITAIGSIMLQSANNALGTICVAGFTAAFRIKMFFLCVFESLGIAMTTFTSQNYGAGKPERVWQGVKVSSFIMLIYAGLTFIILITGAEKLSTLFISSADIDILEKSVQYLHIVAYFFPVLGLLCILRYTIQGAGYTNLAMLSGVFEMVARIVAGLFLVPAFGYIAVCYGDPMAWIAADLFLIPAFYFVYRKIKLFKTTVSGN